MCVMQALLAFAYAALQTGDDAIRGLSLVVTGATLGFFVLNYPRGGIFLGDGGAYSLGFVVVEIALLLVHRNPRISPMFPVLVCIYPIFETLFTLYRRHFIHHTAAGRPDALHLHHLVYMRLTRRDYDRGNRVALRNRNSMTSPWLWLLSGLPMIPAVMFWNRTAVLLPFLLLFMVVYVLAYRQIARFRVPRWVTRGWR
jgi:UDP-N-acetylmuramyl pentapeptide phosphotransferase/UDP-N-acetylglucosamine-1-phosphate transferase